MTPVSSRFASGRPGNSAVPYGDIGVLAGAARRTRVARAVVVLSLVGLVVAAAVASRGAESGTGSGIIPAGTSGVLVLDLSKSVIDAEYLRFGPVLERLVDTNTPTGLVIFSDVAYELLPPGSPASALRPVERFFASARGHFPKNPWEATFRAGTRISTALGLAGSMLRRDHVVHGSIVLMSDLETASSDVTKLAQTLGDLRRAGVTVRVIPLFATDEGRRFFGSLLGPNYAEDVPQAGAVGTRKVGTVGGDAPVALLLAVGLLLLALAANERFSARLALPRAEHIGERDV